jgi:8-oxo-dGTP pyrophosphatase MutT (NUDIX family)
MKNEKDEEILLPPVGGVIPEAGVIPYRIGEKGLEVLLISTSSGKNLTIPKGMVDPGFSETETLVQEAHEEAGIRGLLSPQPLGLYRFEKWRRICEVRVFAMQVTEFSENWPESGMRCRIWTNPERAEEVVKHKELGELIGNLSSWLMAQEKG